MEGGYLLGLMRGLVRGFRCVRATFACILTMRRWYELGEMQSFF